MLYKRARGPFIYHALRVFIPFLSVPASGPDACFGLRRKWTCVKLHTSLMATSRGIVLLGGWRRQRQRVEGRIVASRALYRNPTGSYTYRGTHKYLNDGIFIIEMGTNGTIVGVPINTYHFISDSKCRSLYGTGIYSLLENQKRLFRIMVANLVNV